MTACSLRLQLLLAVLAVLAALAVLLTVTLSDSWFSGSKIRRPSSCVDRKTTVIVLVASETGSTWLGQLLDNHPCSGGFRPPGFQLKRDGHFRPSDEEEVLTALQHPHVIDRPHGFLITPDHLDGILNLSGTRRRHKQAGLDDGLNGTHARNTGNQNFTGATPRRGVLAFPKPLVILWLHRDPFFMAVSRMKKRALFQAKKEQPIPELRKNFCLDVNHQSNRCPGAINFTFTAEPKEFIEQVHNQTLALKELEQFAHSMREKYGAAVHRVDYAALQCQSERVLNTLPKKVLKAVHMPTDYNEMEEQVQFAKSSPLNPARQIKNLREVEKMAKQQQLDWRGHFKWPKESFPFCPGRSDVRG